MISFINGMPPGYLQSCPGPDGHDHGMPLPPPTGPYHCWFTMSYLMGFIKPGTTPAPLVTTANALPPGPGALGNPATAIGFGNRLNFPMQSGFRLNFGGYLDNSGCYSLEGDVMYFVPIGVHYQNASDALGNPLIARPFFDVSGSPLVPPPTPGQHAFDYSVPGSFVGGTAINARSELYGFELNGRRYWNCGPQWRADALLGFRYLHLDEHLLIQDSTSNLPGSTLSYLGVPATGLETDFDSFYTRNNFYGGQIGGRLTWQQSWMFISGYGKLALGGMVQQAIINGGTTLYTPAPSSPRRAACWRCRRTSATTSGSCSASCPRSA